MKKTNIRIISLALVIIMACFALASCSNAPSGTYSNEAYALKFSGETVEVTYGDDSKKTTIEGTFEMGEDEEGNMDWEPEWGYYGEVDYQMQYGTVKGEPFDWLYVDMETLSLHADRYGFRTEILHLGTHYDYLTRITRKNND